VTHLFSILVCLLWLVDFSQAVPLKHPCSQDAQRVAPSVSFDILAKSHFLLLDSVFSELSSACQDFLVEALAATEPCLKQVKELCPGKEANKSNRKRCLTKHARELPLRCSQAAWKECTSAVKNSCPSSPNRATCVRETLQSLAPVCRSLMRGREPWEIDCSADFLRFCPKSTEEEPGRFKCMRSQGKNLSHECRIALVNRWEVDTVCKLDLLSFCEGQELVPANWHECFLKEREQLSSVCKKQLDTFYLHENCAVPFFPSCKERRGDELINCINSQKIELNDVCKKEMLDRGVR